MRTWWRRFMAMPDRERAKFLALVFGIVIMGLLYILGGLSLYLRARYLQAPALTVTATFAVISEDAGPAQLTPSFSTATLFPTATPTATLFPTLTPSLTLTWSQATPPIDATRPPTQGQE